ncbi:MAG: hypothetical protein C5B53_05920 [Candidatus Melainabacteria bacterium]|nr:MAG: hypothetical protein C5B53_05920 [Candidatus Melainabacteria bacterium]
MKIKLVVLLLTVYSGAAYAQNSGYENSTTDGLRGAIPETSPGVDSDASQPGLHGFEGNKAGQPAPFEGADLTTNKAHKVKKPHHEAGKHKQAASKPEPVTPVSGQQKKSGFELTDPAKTGIGLTDRTAKTGVGLTDRAAKTGAGAGGKAVKEIFKAIF